MLAHIITLWTVDARWVSLSVAATAFIAAWALARRERARS